MPDLAVHTRALTRDFGALRAVDTLSLDVPTGVIVAALIEPGLALHPAADGQLAGGCVRGHGARNRAFRAYQRSL